jgi:hypothetical protein
VQISSRNRKLVINKIELDCKFFVTVTSRSSGPLRFKLPLNNYEEDLNMSPNPTQADSPLSEGMISSKAQAFCSDIVSLIVERRLEPSDVFGAFHALLLAGEAEDWADRKEICSGLQRMMVEFSGEGQAIN